MAYYWGQCGTDFNRYIQKLRRLHNVQVQYLRSVEAHADSYPHVHIILQFETPISVNNDRYFDNALYSKWKKLWTGGLSDYQPPRYGRQPILYIVKYVAKNTPTWKTLWKKILPAPVTVTSDGNGQTPAVTVNHSAKEEQTVRLCKEYNIKQLTWSRKFKFPTLPRGGRGGTPVGLDNFI